MTIQVLASDFTDNKFMNFALDETGCPLVRALIRAGVNPGDYGDISNSIRSKVLTMFDGIIPTEDFTFEFEKP